ncbi:30S ribosomal protein S4, partial [Candidatus Woesearchaeota archaeon]|nr:30S ribosomal protein S4 [Candidatus Woesearchaeota archaeon]
LVSEYGIKNKKELWKYSSRLRDFKTQAKRYASKGDEHAEKQKELFISKLIRLGLISEGEGLDHVLGMELKDLLDRRLQTQVVKKGLASTMKQARQFIVHHHIAIGEKKVSMPGYLVKKAEENKISFAATSDFRREDHPEITNINKKNHKEGN